MYSLRQFNLDRSLDMSFQSVAMGLQFSSGLHESYGSRYGNIGVHVLSWISVRILSWLIVKSIASPHLRRIASVTPIPSESCCRVFISSDFVTGAIRLQGPFYLFVSFKSRTFILSGSVEIHLVSSWNLDVGARAIHACSTSFQTLPFGLINVGTDYFMLVVVTYSGIHHMLPIWFSNGRARLTRFALLSLVLIFCFMMFIKPSRIPPVLILSQLSIAPDVIV
ncbi:hypothetical protein Bca4012_101663 [Brassica carinata]